jgi:hypothetical protein
MKKGGEMGSKEMGFIAVIEVTNRERRKDDV